MLELKQTNTMTTKKKKKKNIEKHGDKAEQSRQKIIIRLCEACKHFLAELLAGLAMKLIFKHYQKLKIKSVIGNDVVYKFLLEGNNT